MRLATLLFATLAAAAPQLSKRCRLGRSIQPCWVRWDHNECSPYIPQGVEYSIDREHAKMTITGLCESCSTALVREQARTEPYGDSDNWAKRWGRVEDLGGGTFVITGMDQYGLDFYQDLNRFPQEWGTSCVD
ncbi:hypothetical protein OQA88_2394 [Cercophora sp. LCS_1]